MSSKAATGIGADNLTAWKEDAEPFSGERPALLPPSRVDTFPADDGFLQFKA
jgi:hypothetical protein